MPSFYLCRWGLMNCLPRWSWSVILLISDPQLAGITGMSHHAWPEISLLLRILVALIRSHTKDLILIWLNLYRPHFQIRSQSEGSGLKLPFGHNSTCNILLQSKHCIQKQSIPGIDYCKFIWFLHSPPGSKMLMYPMPKTWGGWRDSERGIRLTGWCGQIPETSCWVGKCITEDNVSETIFISKRKIKEYILQDHIHTWKLGKSKGKGAVRITIK
jgi:hypothetical protein